MKSEIFQDKYPKFFISSLPDNHVVWKVVSSEEVDGFLNETKSRTFLTEGYFSEDDNYKRFKRISMAEAAFLI
jgi:hypothetical protein